MRAYPEKMSIKGETFYFEKILKDDFFSVNVLYRNPEGVRYVLKLSDFRFFLGSLLKPLAMFFSWREYKIYKMLEDIEGIPPLGPRFGRRGYFHKYIEGKTLHDMEQGGTVPDDFFGKLKSIISQLHDRRIFYLDLNKRGNIIIGEDMQPYLIDFQISLFIRKKRGLAGLIADGVFNRLIREDIYHLYKHKRHFQPQLMTDEELGFATRTRFNEALNRYLGTPYRKVKRLIYPHGSNEIVWYKWKKMKDRSKRMP
jgi:serine/threonine protein kinase